MNATQANQTSFDTLLLAIQNSSVKLEANIKADINATHTDLTSSIQDVGMKLDEVNMATNACTKLNKVNKVNKANKRNKLKNAK